MRLEKVEFCTSTFSLRVPSYVMSVFFSLFRCLVPSSNCLRPLPASHPSLARHCTPLCGGQGGPEVWLASCHFGHVHQQVRPPVCKPLPDVLVVTNQHCCSALSVCVLFSVGGLILDNTVSNPDYEGMAVFTPVINGESTGASSKQIRYADSVVADLHS